VLPLDTERVGGQLLDWLSKRWMPLAAGLLGILFPLAWGRVSDDIFPAYYVALGIMASFVYLYYRGWFPFTSDGAIGSFLWYFVALLPAVGMFNGVLHSPQTAWWYPTRSPLWSILPVAMISAVFACISHYKYGRPWTVWGWLRHPHGGTRPK
jgi:hypothetical protein